MPSSANSSSTSSTTSGSGRVYVASSIQSTLAGCWTSSVGAAYGSRWSRRLLAAEILRIIPCWLPPLTVADAIVSGDGDLRADDELRAEMAELGIELWGIRTLLDKL